MCRVIRNSQELPRECADREINFEILLYAFVRIHGGGDKSSHCFKSFVLDWVAAPLVSSVLLHRTRCAAIVDLESEAYYY